MFRLANRDAFNVRALGRAFNRINTSSFKLQWSFLLSNTDTFLLMLVRRFGSTSMKRLLADVLFISHHLHGGLSVGIAVRENKMSDL